MVDQGNFWSSYNVPYFKEIFEYAGYDRAVEKMEMSGPGRTPPEPESSAESRAVSKISPPTRRSWDTTNSRTTRNPKETPPTRSLQEVTSTLLPPEDQLSSPTMPRQPLYSEFVIKMDVHICWITVVSDIQNGPTHDDQKPFKWSDFNFKNSHVGQPDLWNFDWITIQRDQWLGVSI